MAVQLAKLQNEPQQRQGPLYRPQAQPMAPQEKGMAGQVMDTVTNRAMTKGVDYGEEKLTEGFSSMMAPSIAAPSAAQMTTMSQMAGMPSAAGAGLSPGAAQAVLGSGSSAAPLVAQAAGQTAGQLAATTGGQLATGAATNAAAAGAGTGLMATLGTAVPYIGAAILAGKAFGLFNKGGYVNGPLAAGHQRTFANKQGEGNETQKV